MINIALPKGRLGEKVYNMLERAADSFLKMPSAESDISGLSHPTFQSTLSAVRQT